MKEALKRLFKSSSVLVLVVDDDKDNLLLARFIVESLGFRCLVCSDSRQALALVREFTPNLILLDIVMPNLSGIDIAHRIKRDCKLKKIPLIAVTGLARTKEEELIFAAGFSGYIRKPYLIEELEVKIQR